MPRNPRPVKKSPILEVVSSVLSTGGGGGSTTVNLTGTAPIQIDGASGAPTLLSVDRTISIDGSALGSMGALGGAYYGDGSDGDLTLGGNTTLTASRYVFNYNDVNLAGYTLTAANEFTLLMIKGTLTLGGGTVQAYRGAVNAGGIPADPTKAGTGGDGGGVSSAIWVFAKTIVGTGTISANGRSGTGGGDGANAAGVNSGVGGGVSAGANQYLFGHIFAVTTAAGGGGSGAVGAIAGVKFNATDLITTKNPMAWLRIADNYYDVASKWYNNFGGAGGGGSGEGQAGNTPGGGAGGGGGGFINDGGAGGRAEARAGGIAGWSGAGGGGGAAGGCALVIAGTAPSTLTISANGGNGGAGGTFTVPGSGGAGGGGGGGAGGLVMFVAQAGNGASVSATGGTGGVHGSNGAGGTAAANGLGGGLGVTMSMTRS